MSDDSQRKIRKDKGVRRKKSVDETYSFRLDPSVPREAEAIQIINHYRQQLDETGHYVTLRQIMIEAVLALRDMNMPDVGHSSADTDSLIESFENQLRRLDATITRLSEMNVSAQPPQPNRRKPKSGVNLDYLQNLRNAINPGDE